MRSCIEDRFEVRCQVEDRFEGTEDGFNAVLGNLAVKEALRRGLGNLVE